MNDDKVLMLRQRLSALADGELGLDDVASVMAVPALDVEVQSTWHAYHLIGDVLRGGEQAVSPGAAGFVSRLQMRLQAEEPLATAPAARTLEPVAAAAVVNTRAEPANDASFRWKLLAGCASFAAVLAVTWGIVGGTGLTAAQPQLAAVPPAELGVDTSKVAGAPPTVEQPIVMPNGEAQVMIRDARLDELLTAHKQAGGGTALQMPAGFLRSATFAVPER